MILCIADVLTPQDLVRLRALFADAPFQDGTRTAGWHARLVKDNQQMAGTVAAEAQGIVLAALKRNPLFRSAVLPRRIRPPLLARYTGGQTYGDHVDDAIMGEDDPVRSDVSCTVFLRDPDEYEGGELVMDTTGGEQVFKLPAGAAITYPSYTLHRVAPVTGGVREVAVTWIQSMVREADRREILFDLDRSRRSVFDEQGKTPLFDTLTKSHANLLRLWAEI
ncbi:Fe2+-dependent dioxygenase [Novispirillum sp. DQ9]|uniref:Fe2+-dependent dioxygenase n=1 Tax=Novispirillum sp. DQ9 TaxID=3398612 RepID=UPI003C7AEE34